MTRRTNTLVITNDCNLRCSYCYIPDKKKVTMSKEIMKASIEMLPHAEETIWELIGGEPLLEPELISYAYDLLAPIMKEEKYVVSMTTNGTQFKDPSIRALLEKNAYRTSVGLSIDGGKEVHDLNRCNSFDDAMEYFDWWRKTFPWNSTKSTVNKLTLPYLSNSVQFLVSLGLTNIPINLIYEEDWGMEDFTMYMKQLDEIGDFLIDTGKASIKVSLFDRGLLLRNKAKRNWCGSGEFMTAVNPQGFIYPCNRFVDSGIHPIGHVNTGIEQDRVLPFLLSHHKIDQCGECSLMGNCPGCLAFDYQETGSIFKRSLKPCIMHIVRVKANERFWARVDGEGR